MKAKALLMLLVATIPLQGCFFFYVPGSVTGSVSDAVTGDEGENCVAGAAKVGDLVTTADGKPLTIKSLSGKSSRCTDPNSPIRALLVSAAAQSKLKLNLSPGWTAYQLSNEQTKRGFVARAGNSDLGAELFLSSVTRYQAGDVQQFISTTAQAHAKRLINPDQTPVRELTCSGRGAFEVDITGTINGKLMASADIFIPGDTEMALVSTSVAADKFTSEAAALKATCDFVTGL